MQHRIDRFIDKMDMLFKNIIGRQSRCRELASIEVYFRMNKKVVFGGIRVSNILRLYFTNNMHFIRVSYNSV